MRALISLITLAVVFATSAIAADSVKTDPDPAKPGRALDESVKATGGDSGKAGRRIDDTEIKTPMSPFLDGVDKKDSHKKHERGLDKTGTRKLKDAEGSAVDPCTVGACLDKAKKYKKVDVLKQNQTVSDDVKTGKKDVNRTPRAAFEEVKSGKDSSEKQGRALDKADKQ